jgi:hypothetical protein
MKRIDRPKVGVSSTSYDLIDVLWHRMKGYSFSEWLRDQRDNGNSFRAIANRLEDATDGDVTIPYRTIAHWVKQLEEEVSA